MKLMTKQDEKYLIEKVQETCELVNKGENPTEALSKVSKDNLLNKSQIRRVAEAYNQAATLSHLEEKQGADRNSFFSLADPDVIIKDLYPEKEQNLTEKVSYDLVKHSVRSCNSNLIKAKLQKNEIDSLRSPYTKAAHEKQASELNSDKYFTKQALQRVSHELVEDKQKVLELYKEAADYLTRNFYNAPFEEVETWAKTKYGDSVNDLMDSLWEETEADKRGQKRASNVTDASKFTLMDFKPTSFASIENLVEAAVNLNKKSREKKEYETKVAEINTLLDEIDHKKKANHVISNSFEKYSKPGDSGGTILGKSYNYLRSPFDKLKEEGRTQSGHDRAVQDNLNKLLDPDFRDDIHQIKVQAILHDLMTNDDVISSYDPDTVIDNYNKIYQSSPHVATNPGVVQDMLRRALVQDGLGTMEFGQAADIGSDSSESEAKTLEFYYPKNKTTKE